MCPRLTSLISPVLKKRMQGKTCFNFKGSPEPQLLQELESLTVGGTERMGGSKMALKPDIIAPA